MTKTVTKIGNSKGIILDSALLELVHWKEGDQLSVTMHDGGSITFTPLKASIKPEQAAALTDSIISSNDELFSRLAK
ncbi:MAG: MazE family transcriptional regulator [Verrucomicrobiota bacterium]